MKSCRNCMYCVTTLKLKDRDRTKRVFKDEWANKRLTFNGIKCQKKMWLKEDMTEKTYRAFSTQAQNKNWKTEEAFGCPHYTV